jgi:hypothetical protein
MRSHVHTNVSFHMVPCCVVEYGYHHYGGICRERLKQQGSNKIVPVQGHESIWGP